MANRKRNLRPERSDRSADAARPPYAAHPARAAWATAAVLVLAGWLVYGRAIDAPFIFDDDNGIVTNESITALWPLVGTGVQPGPLNPPKYLPSSGRPLVNLSLALNYRFGQLDPTGYHVVNVTLHTLSAVLLWAIVRRTLQLPFFSGRFDAAAGWLALAVAALWELHPLQTEAVTYTIQRTELMMAQFYLATLYCGLRYWTALPLPPGEGRGEGAPIRAETNEGVFARRGIWLALATLACLAGMASKEVMVSAPLVVLLFERTFVARSLKEALRNSWPLYAGLASGWMLLLWLNLNTPRDDSAGFHLGVPAYVWWFTQAKVLVMYLKLAVWPTPLLIHYELPYLDLFTAAWMYVLPVALLIMATLLLLWRNHPVGFLGTVVFAVLSPTLIVPITTEVAAERRMYLPLAALVAAVVVGSYAVAQWWMGPAARVRHSAFGASAPLMVIGAAALGAALALGVASGERLAAYNDPLGLWQQVVSLQPHNHIAQQNIATELYQSGRVSEAIEHYRQAIRLNPDAAQAHFNLGLVLFNTGKAEEAIPCFRQAVRLLPKSADMRNNLGVALFAAGQNEEAARVLRQTVDLKPDMWRAHDNFARALAKGGDFPQAIEHYERALQINPQAFDVYSHLAAAHARANQPDKAINAMERALDVARSSADEQMAEKLAAQIDAYRSTQANGTLAQPNSRFESNSPSN